ncbi:MAG: hypothetical protein SNI91_00175, partial [Rikenellaceae bacterium]
LYIDNFNEKYITAHKTIVHQNIIETSVSLAPVDIAILRDTIPMPTATSDIRAYSILFSVLSVFIKSIRLIL